mmetsp:Transcript_57523/g.141459  ORF Transcript_57523/g.141459 Transcript_57523/m.141459 type:complete len:81 (+) Transcript_57523:77-319(+)
MKIGCARQTVSSGAQAVMSPDKAQNDALRKIKAFWEKVDGTELAVMKESEWGKFIKKRQRSIGKRSLKSGVWKKGRFRQQ